MVQRTSHFFKADFITYEHNVNLKNTMYDAFITGASGFIGSHLTEFLISKHKSIIATYHNKEKLLESIKSLKKVRWDITEDFEKHSIM